MGSAAEGREAPDLVQGAAVLAAVKRWLLAMLAPKRALRVAAVPPRRRGAFDLRCARQRGDGQVGTKKRSLEAEPRSRG